MSDAKNLQPLTIKPIEDEVVLETIHTPRPDVLQVPTAKVSQPSLEWVLSQPLDSLVNRRKKSKGGIGITLPKILEVGERIQLGVMTDENLGWVHLAEDRRPLRSAKAAKWPSLYRLSGLRKECRSAASNSGSVSSCSTSW